MLGAQLPILRRPFDLALHLSGRVCLAAAIATASIALGACEDQDQRFTLAQGPRTPIALGANLLLVSPGDTSALLIDASGDAIQPESRRIELPPGLRATVARAGDHDEVLLLSAGERGVGGGQQTPPVLVAVRASGSQRTYPLDSDFDTLVQSEDGRYAVLYRSNPGDRLLNTATEIAIIDLDRSGADGVTLQALSNLGETPTAVAFGPAMSIAGERRRLAVIFGQRKLALIDLNHPGRRETAVELTSDLARNVSPQQVLFDPTEARLFVRAAGAVDMYSLRLLGPVNNPGGNDFRPTIDLIDVGGNPQSAAITLQAGEPLLVATNGNAFTLVDINAGTSQRVETEVAVNQAVLVEMDNRDTELVLWANGAQRVLFATVAEVRDRGDRAVELSSSLNGSLQSLRRLPDAGRLLGMQGGGLVVVDVAARTVTPLSSRRDLSGAVVDQATGRVWVAPPGQPSVGFLELGSGATGEVLLDDEVEFLTLLPAAGRIAVSHPDATGHITFLEADAPSRDTAQAIRGFLLTDLLD